MTTRYLMVSMRGNRHWMSEGECAAALNAPWYDGGVAMDTDGPDAWVERPLTQEEKDRITRRSHEMSAWK